MPFRLIPSVGLRPVRPLADFLARPFSSSASSTPAGIATVPLAFTKFADSKSDAAEPSSSSAVPPHRQHHPGGHHASSLPPLIILHGLFGSKQNWNSLGRSLSQGLGRHVFALDLRNHGESPHTSEHDVPSMAADVGEFCRRHNLNDIDLMGHSMGGRVAMHFALSHPPTHNAPVESPRVRKLILVDIAPRIPTMTNPSLFRTYLDAMVDIESRKLTDRKQVDQVLAATVPELSVRQFLLTNLVGAGAGQPLRFRVNLPTLSKNLNKIYRFPLLDEVPTPFCPSETLAIRGSRSTYVPDNVLPMMRDLFPNLHIVTLDAGHWVHAERPHEFLDAVKQFVSR